MELSRELAAKVLEIVDQGLVKGVGLPEPGKLCVEAAVVYAMGLPHGDDPSCVAPGLRRLKIGLNDSDWSSNEARAKGLRRLAIAQLGSAGALDEKEFARRCADLAIRSCVPAALRAAAKIQKAEKHRAALLNAADRCERDGGVENARKAGKIADAAYADAAHAAAEAAAAAHAAYAAHAAAEAAAIASAEAAADAAEAAAYAEAAAAAWPTAAAAAAAWPTAAAAESKARDEQLSAFAEGVVQILIAMRAPGCEWLDLTEAA
jgi:hypothetical protein